MLTQQLQHYLASQDRTIQMMNDNSVMLLNDNNQEVLLDLSPLHLPTKEITASKLFDNIQDAFALIHAYYQAKQSMPFEEDNPTAQAHVSHYAHTYMLHAIEAAQKFTPQQARLIGDFVKNLDIYTAVRCCETFFANTANLQLLEVAHAKGWTPIFDHLAIRTGARNSDDAKYIANYLIKYHGYSFIPVEGQAFYEFSDGWSAYIIYKQLKNGMLLRLFIDQSDTDTQIIQHWNHAYGYTAHHLGIRCIQAHKHGFHAMSIMDIAKALEAKKISIMKPTGLYTKGLLEQVFTQPQRDENLPLMLKERFDSYDPGLFEIIKNAKLLEIVSRKELPFEFKKLYFKDLNMVFEEDNPLHSAVFYNFFLPAQAAHVIKSSIELAG